MVKVDSYNRDTVLYTKFYDSHNLTIRTFSCDYIVTVYERDSDDNIVNDHILKLREHIKGYYY